LGLLIQELRVAIHLNNQGRSGAFRQGQPGGLSEAVQGPAVHEFEGGGNDLLADNGGYGLGSTVNGIKHHQHGLLGLGFGKQLDNDLGDNGQGSFRTTEELGQVVSHYPLHGGATGFHQIA